MAYLRIKHIKGYPYLYLCKTIRNGKKVNQKVIQYIGRVNGIEKLSDELIKKVFERDQYKCVKCNSKENLTIDHIIPLLKSGKNKEENLQVLCTKCNIIKGGKLGITEVIKKR